MSPCVLWNSSYKYMFCYPLPLDSYKISYFSWRNMSIGSHWQTATLNWEMKQGKERQELGRKCEHLRGNTVPRLLKQPRRNIASRKCAGEQCGEKQALMGVRSPGLTLQLHSKCENRGSHPQDDTKCTFKLQLARLSAAQLGVLVLSRSQEGEAKPARLNSPLFS